MTPTTSPPSARLSTPPTAPTPSSPTTEATIERCLQHFEFADAVTLAELYYGKTKSDAACHLLAKSLYVSGYTNFAANLIKTHEPKTPQLRFLLAKILIGLKKYGEAELLLVKQKTGKETPELHPELKDTEHEAFAHSLLATLYKETNKTNAAARHFQRAVIVSPVLWNNVKRYAEFGGKNIVEALQGIDIPCDEKKKNAQNDTGEIRYMTRQRVKNKHSSLVSSPREKEQAINALISEDKAKQVSPRRAHGSPLSTINSSTPTVISNPIITHFGGDEHVEAEPMDVENHEPRNRLPVAEVKESQRDKDEIYGEIYDYMKEMANIQNQLNRFKLDDAVGSLNALPQARKDLPLSLELLGRVLVEKVEYEQAAMIFTKLHQTFPYHVDGMDMYSTALWQLRMTAPLSALSCALTHDARHRSESWCAAGNLYSLEKQSATAVECFDRATHLYPQCGYAQCLLGMELIEVGQLDRAERVFQEALVYGPHEYRPHLGLGIVEHKRARHYKATECIRRACNINKANVVLNCHLAVMYQSGKKSDNDSRALNNAIRVLSNAITSEPHNLTLRYHYSRALYESKKYEEAKNELERLKQLSPHETHIYKLLSRIYRRLGDKQKAKVNEVLSTRDDEIAVGEQPYDEEDVDVDESGQPPILTQSRQN